MWVMNRFPRALAVALPLPLLLAACAGTGDDGTADGDGTDGPRVVAAFYPLEYAAERVVGDVEGVQIETLTAPGVEPHDLELTPRQVGRIQESDLVIYSGGMQAAVDDAVAGQAPDHSLDVTTVVDLTETGHAGHDHDEDEDHNDHDDHDDHDGEDHDGHDHGGVDPHFWLDPERYAASAEAIAEELAALDQDHAQDYRDNAAAFAADLGELDTEFTEGLADCQHDTIVTTHQAFGYLTDRYGLEQVGITGLSPDVEASPARVAEISRTVSDLGVSTIYSEVLLGSDLAEVIAAETGTEVLVLDPVEGITEASAGTDYPAVMRANLQALQTGLGCA